MHYRFNAYLVTLMLFIYCAGYAQYNKILSNAEDDLQNGLIYTAIKNLNEADTIRFSAADNAYRNYLLGNAYSYINEEDNSFTYYLKARKQYLAIDSIDKAMEINIDIAYLLSAQEHNKANYFKYLQEYYEYVRKSRDSLKLARGYANMAVAMMDVKQHNMSRWYFKKALKIAEAKGEHKLLSGIYNNMSVLYNEKLGKPDSALFFLEKDRELIKESGTVEDVCHNYINMAASYHYKKDYKKAIEYLHLAEALPIKNYSLRMRQYIYEFLAENYKDAGDNENAYKYLALNRQYEDSISVSDQNIAITDIEAKYETREKQLENEVLKSDLKSRSLVLYIAIGLIMVAVLVGFLLYRNIKRKEQLAQREKVISQQKMEKALKDYELNSIDLMLEGQERERQRIANDLHDNLGSMLATLKLNFENLRIRQNELRDEETRLYTKTDELIEEAYQKVRRLAHAKNAGVFASEGLIPALQKLADKVSVPHKLEFRIISYGFNERLNNTLEITIFRFVQELATNIIKHAGATESTIQLTHHDHAVNIIVEDNGKGFEKDSAGENEGMGLYSIRKKTEQLNGTLQIDSKPGKGTTVIIDLPI